MDHQDWPGWPGDDPNLADADTADLGGHDGDLDHFGHDPMAHDPLGHDPLGHDPLAGDPLGHDPSGADPYGPAGSETGSGIGHDLPAGFEHDPPGTTGTGHGHAGAGEVYPDDDPFAAAHDDTVAHDGSDLHDAGVVHDGSGHDVGYEAAGYAMADHPVGADPDIDPRADDWADPAFPAPLDLHGGAPEPVDGFPWSDPQVLGAADDGGHRDDWPHPPVGDLYDYAGEEQAAGGDAWQALLGSDDPATSSLARWWAPGG
jgi:hypothetical protein